tara:strand:+ start:441 stop:1049 length:609 start_codon:yes stop_codon:yes gene_type:complete
MTSEPLHIRLATIKKNYGPNAVRVISSYIESLISSILANPEKWLTYESLDKILSTTKKDYGSDAVVVMLQCVISNLRKCVFAKHAYSQKNIYTYYQEKYSHVSNSDKQDVIWESYKRESISCTCCLMKVELQLDELRYNYGMSDNMDNWGKDFIKVLYSEFNNMRQPINFLIALGDQRLIRLPLHDEHISFPLGDEHLPLPL